MNKRNFPPKLWVTSLVALVFLGLAIDHTVASSKSDPFYNGISLYERVIQKVQTFYVEDVDMDAMTRHAIKGALEVLDPHTTFFEPKDYEELMVHTEGEFGGLGIQISIRDKYLTVMTPIAGTPAERAGIRSGDRILKIDGKLTKGITLEKAVNQMRGKPGTNVTITISREGETESVDFEIERAIIKIKSVPYIGLVADSIGYLQLTTFSQDAGEAVKKGVDSLLTLGAKGIIFDMRFNPGGLLTQAQEVSSVFIPENKLVVFTKGRLKSYSDSLFTNIKPTLPQGMPLVVLVNGASASAAEIVSGAVQDWDCGVILGDTTFGKGSVQTVLPIDKERHIKLTTAFYYTPSGRCINRPENGIRGDKGEDSEDLEEQIVGEDSTAETKDVKKVVPSEVYYTANKRPVFGGGGVIPDTIVEDMPEPFMVRKLMLKDLFFKFANQLYPSFAKEGIKIDTSFSVSETLLKRFYNYLDSAKFDYSMVAENKLDDFKVYVGFRNDTSIDKRTLEYVKSSIGNEDSVKMTQLLSEMEKILQKSRRAELDKESDEVRSGLRMALLVREMGQDNDYIYKVKLKNDAQVLAAIGLIKSPKNYKALLAPKKK